MEDLLQALVHEAIAHTHGSAEGEVLLDVEVDGVRCLLLVPEHVASTRVSLSPREWEIVLMVADGWPNKTIAHKLGISSWTVSTHLRRIFAKLGVRSRAAMVARVVGQRPAAAPSPDALPDGLSRS
jgi:DNA-binding NarL/FixJ family response regulator